jgi:hypothetical protein
VACHALVFMQDRGDALIEAHIYASETPSWLPVKQAMKKTPDL